MRTRFRAASQNPKLCLDWADRAVLAALIKLSAGGHAEETVLAKAAELRA
jgi:hypothetical protein